MASLLEKVGLRSPPLNAPRGGELHPFDPAFAATVAGWVRSDDELFHLSPRTPPPLTSAKVLEWGRAGGAAFLHIASPGEPPCGYVELNPMPNEPGHWWMGHCLVAPAARGRREGSRIVRLLLREAFVSREARRLSLVVFPGNVEAVRCYQSAGFVTLHDVYRSFDTRPGTHRMLYMTIDAAGFAAARPA